MKQTFSTSDAYYALRHVYDDVSRLHNRVAAERHKIAGEAQAFVSIKYDQLMQGFSTVFAGMTPDSVVDHMAKWGFGDAPRQALVKNRTKTDEVLYASLKSSVQESSARVNQLKNEFASASPLATQAKKVLELKETLESIRAAASLPELTQENYGKTSFFKTMTSSAYRTITRSLRDYEKENGSLLEKIPGAQRYVEKNNALYVSLQDAVATDKRRKEALSKFETAIVIPVSDEKFIEQQIKFATATLVEEEEFPKQKAEAILQTHPAFAGVVDMFAKLQAQRRIVLDQYSQFDELLSATRTWYDKIAPACNKLDRHSNNRKATVDLDLTAIHKGLRELDKAVSSTMTELARQREEAMGIMALTRPQVEQAMQKSEQSKSASLAVNLGKSNTAKTSNQPTSSSPNQSSTDQSSANQASYDSGSSNFWLYYWMFLDGNSYPAAPTLSSNVGLPDNLTSTKAQALSIDISDIKVDPLTSSVDSLQSLDFDIQTPSESSGSSNNHTQADPSPSNCGGGSSPSSCSSCGGGGGGGCGGD